MGAMHASLKQNGVADKDITTQGFSIQPQDDFNPTKAGALKIIGYTAMNQVSVKVRQMDSLTKMLDGAVTASVKMGKVRSVIEGGGANQPFPYPSALAPPMTGFGGKGGDTPVSPGETELVVVVSVTFGVAGSGQRLAGRYPRRQAGGTMAMRLPAARSRCLRDPQ